MSDNGICLRIRGKVQGVGFRPFVWQLAQRLNLAGDVCNDSAGVLVRLYGDSQAFVNGLHHDCPPLARIDSIEPSPFHWGALPQGFAIRQSETQGAMVTQIAPDAATCPDCLAEMNDPLERRYRYPFINCTHCGPRLTIIRAMPYDRPNTVMAAFPLCSVCESEYQNPADRRFHAQPVACPECGPQLSWQRSGEPALAGEEALQQAVACLLRGEIVAVKGLGGFHLACDATSQQAVMRLRQRKQRPGKPLAVMLPDAASLSASAQELLLTPAAPVVLVDKTQVNHLCSAIAPGLNEVGVMVPANPIQHLLMQGVKRPLVMTSGNLSGKPPVLSNEEACSDLADIADGFLLHNRDILQRMDDSVLAADGAMLRRARGFVPDALLLPPGFTAVEPLASLGGDLKNTFCLVRGNQAVISQHLGDLHDPQVEKQWWQAWRVMCEVYGFSPRHIVADAHTGYRAYSLACEMGLPVQTVLHHHAHLAACMGEHGLPRETEPVIGLSLDGIGMGSDGALWGGECLLVDYRQCRHLGGLPAVALPGADLAARQPWRNFLAQCLAFVPGWQSNPHCASLLAHPWAVLEKAITRGINAPLASSAGRLFDAVAAALGCVADQQTWEGEAACSLEALALQCSGFRHTISLPVENNTLGLAAFWPAFLALNATVPEKAWVFHDVLAQGFAQLARLHARAQGISTVVCAGGVFHNRLFRQRLLHWLGDYRVLFPHDLPAGDGALSWGQALVAAARLQG
ncbi:carbamoyl phosphate phosphatase [Mangrovibacter sp. MFB070]|uniref:carbamoyltransferase HypF n=1 Tax=Mangrovibacter sp. MFB070 TaxID=1224318 RepID=UPI0004D5DB09|nr:carbamoyltransferase HypF [Mangrovibacter sp. MFB070]KEA52017.1 carbamoyl phosphate phosphatase [Mangrovibacter sp. MFB070]